MTISVLVVLFPMVAVSGGEPACAPGGWNVLRSAGLNAMNRGAYREAENSFASLLRRAETCGAPVPELAMILGDLGRAYQINRKFAESEHTYQRVLQLQRGSEFVNSGELATTLNNLGSLYYAGGRYSQAELHLRESIDLREKMEPVDEVELGLSLFNLAAVYRAQARYSDSEAMLRRVLSIREHTFGSYDLSLAPVLDSLALIRQRQGLNSEAAALS